MSYCVFWMRRDLRLEDNAGLFYALSSGFAVIPFFVFDRNILAKLDDVEDRRVNFIYNRLAYIKKQLKELGSDLLIASGDPVEEWGALINQFNISSVYWNRDYESYALQRDGHVRNMLAQRGIDVHTFKDHVLFEKEDLTKADGRPYTVFTPFLRKAYEKLGYMPSRPDMPLKIKAFPSDDHLNKLWKERQKPIPSLGSLGFQVQKCPEVIPELSPVRMKAYAENRDIPSIEGTTQIGIHLRFGTLSIRSAARKAAKYSPVLLSELLWRDFYSMILQAFPRVETKPFRLEFEGIEWENDPVKFDAWCKGCTGFPMVDAGMRQLNASGFMHNRLRMLTASFLVKHLLVDWRWGEAYFASKLLDYDLASNIGGWQWAAGCGTDAAPYFRIFSPDAQQQRFDPQFTYVRKWVPEYGTSRYPAPIVHHAFARDRFLRLAKAAFNKDN